MLRVLQAAFPAWPKVDTSVSPLDHLRWKMASHPIARRFHLVAECDGNVIAARVFIVREVLFAGRTLLAYTPVDMSVAPEYQDRGILKHIRTFDYKRLEGRSYAESFDMKLYTDSGHPAAKRLQQQIPGSFALGNQLEVLGRANDGRLPSPLGDTSFSLRTVPALDDRLDEFWHAVAPQFDLIYSHSKDVMNWRYADPRAGDFTITIAEDEGALLGYVVTRCSRGRGYIADLLALPKRLDVAGALARHALAEFRNESLERVECWLPAQHPYQPLLRELGFTPRRSALHARYRPFLTPEQDLQLLRDPSARIHFTPGDTDLV